MVMVNQGVTSSLLLADDKQLSKAQSMEEVGDEGMYMYMFSRVVSSERGCVNRVQFTRVSYLLECILLNLKRV